MHRPFPKFFGNKPGVGCHMVAQTTAAKPRLLLDHQTGGWKKELFIRHMPCSFPLQAKEIIYFYNLSLFIYGNGGARILGNLVVRFNWALS